MKDYKNKDYKCGDIYWVQLLNSNGCVQNGKRPCIVLGNSKGLASSTTLQIIPITSKTKNNIPVHIGINCLPKNSTALTEQIQTISKNQIVSYICSIDFQTLMKIKSKILLQLGL